MKTCFNCGKVADEGARQCDGCERYFSAHPRPTGTAPMLIGWLFLAASALLWLVAWYIAPSAWEAELAHDFPTGLTASGIAAAYAKAAPFEAAAGWCFWVFLVLWSVGYLARAIAFLPSPYTRIDKAEGVEAEASGSSEAS